MTLTSIGKISDRFNIINGTITVPDYVIRTLEGVVYETTLMYWVAPYACVITDTKFYLSSNPTAAGSYCTMQIMKNGVLETNSIFASDAAMQITENTSVSNGLYSGVGTLDAAQVTLAAGDVIWMRINRADAGSADLLFLMKVNYL